MGLIVDVFAARSDNFGYLVHDQASGRTAAIDAPEAGPIRAALEQRGWTLTDIFITHHHIDHVEAIAELKQAFGTRVVGPRDEADKIEGLDELVGDGDTLDLERDAGRGLVAKRAGQRGQAQTGPAARHGRSAERAERR